MSVQLPQLKSPRLPNASGTLASPAAPRDLGSPGAGAGASGSPTSLFNSGAGGSLRKLKGGPDSDDNANPPNYTTTASKSPRDAPPTPGMRGRPRVTRLGALQDASRSPSPLAQNALANSTPSVIPPIPSFNNSPDFSAAIRPGKKRDPSPLGLGLAQGELGLMARRTSIQAQSAANLSSGADTEFASTKPRASGRTGLAAMLASVNVTSEDRFVTSAYEL
ncbi:hypothetical protein HK101_004630, partial [Irineochytrium annulatum]